MDAAVVHLADVLVANFPRVHAEPMHPPILPLARELVTRGEAVCATATLEASLPVALVAAAVGIDADADAVNLAVLHMTRVLALHRRSRACAR